MNNVDFKTDIAVDVITKALDDFLRDKSLKITPQKYVRLKKLLMVSLLDTDLSYENAYNTLTDLAEYRKDYEIDANATDEAEEEMIRIIGAADKEEVQVVVENYKYKKRFMTALSVLILIILGFVAFGVSQYYQHSEQETLKMAQVITTAEEIEFKNLVQQLVEAEKLNGNDITHNAIYNEVKNLDAVKSAGNATSYKKFNYLQLREATEYINHRLSNILLAVAN